MVPRVLVVEDDPVIGSTLESTLRVGGFETEWVSTAELALGSRASDPDLILLDVGLPDGDGFAVCRELRTRYGRATIVMLTARREPLDVVEGLESGADDYLFKPFSVVELMARVRAHVRRSGSNQPDDRRVEFGSLLIDRGSRSAWLGPLELPLRQREFDLLARLADSSGAAVSRETLMADVWDENWFGSTKTLDVHMVSLRRKLAGAAAAAGLEASMEAPVIRTLRGHGYQLQLGASRPERP